MLTRKKFRIKALLVVRKDDDGKIIHREVRPDIDWDVDPVMGVTTNEQIWIKENGVDVLYLHTLVEYDDKDHQYFIDKGWVVVE